jgi:D-tyrosyl-tRNA(Tyr) deacylase
MIGLLQRVRKARVEVQGETVAAIDEGVLVLVGVERGDVESSALKLLTRLLGYRVFADEQGRKNICLRDAGGALLLVPQFTLAADTRKGMRASFASAAPPEVGARLFEYLVMVAGSCYPKVQCGHFGADMQVSLVNDGPVTFWLQSR